MWYDSIFKKNETTKKNSRSSHSALEMESEVDKSTRRNSANKDDDDEFGVDFVKSPYVDPSLVGVTHLNLTRKHRSQKVEAADVFSTPDLMTQVQSVRHETKLDPNFLGIGTYQSQGRNFLKYFFD